MRCGELLRLDVERVGNLDQAGLVAGEELEHRGQHDRVACAGTKFGCVEAGNREQARPKVAAVLARVHERAPMARVAIVGYPAAAPVDGRGCYPIVPASPDDLAYLNELLVRINTMIREVASVGDAEFVDVLPLVRRTFGTFSPVQRRALAQRLAHGDPVVAAQDGERFADLAAPVVATAELILGAARG